MMNQGKPEPHDPADVLEIARQAEVEVGILLGIEQTLRIALRWMTRGRGNSHKLSTLRFQTWAFERQLVRLQGLADHGGYMHLITGANPSLTPEVQALEDERDALHSNLQGVIVRLERVSGDDMATFGEICTDLESALDALRAHGERERELLQRSFYLDEGGEG
jgi:hypothetical protein